MYETTWPVRGSLFYEVGIYSWCNRMPTEDRSCYRSSGTAAQMYKMYYFEIARGSRLARSPYVVCWLKFAPFRWCLAAIPLHSTLSFLFYTPHVYICTPMCTCIQFIALHSVSISLMDDK